MTVAVLATLGTYLPERDMLRAVTALFYFFVKNLFSEKYQGNDTKNDMLNVKESHSG